jgi:hypothetical protein
VGGFSGRALAAALGVVLLVAAVWFVVARSGPGVGSEEEATGSAPVQLSVPSGAEVDLDGERLVISIPVHNAGHEPVVVSAVPDPPPGFTPALPSDGVVVRAGVDAVLPVAWEGPQCDGAAPEHLLPELTVEVTRTAARGSQTPRGGPEEIALDTGSVDQLLLQARRNACADQAPPTPADEVVG